MVLPGTKRRSDKDEKVTTCACYDAVAEGRSYKKIWKRLRADMDIIDGLDLNLNLDHGDRIEVFWQRQDGVTLPHRGRTANS